MSARTSVIVPLYNASTTIERALLSVLAQSDPDFEVLVIDDGSVDDSVARVGALAETRVRILQHAENRGISAARNTGLAEAAGEFVAFLDADDSWESDFLERMHAARGGADAVVCGRTVVLPDGSERREHSERLGSMAGDVAAELMMTGQITPFPWDKIVHRSAFADVHYPEEIRRFEDQVVGVIALSRTRTVVSIADSLVRYHVAASSLTWGRTPRLDEAEAALHHLEVSLGGWLDVPRRRRAYRVCRTITLMLTAQSAMRSRDQSAAAVVLVGCRRGLSARMIAATAFRRPVFGAGALLLKIAPGLYRGLFVAYVKRQYALT